MSYVLGLVTYWSGLFAVYSYSATEVPSLYNTLVVFLCENIYIFASRLYVELFERFALAITKVFAPPMLLLCYMDEDRIYQVVFCWRCLKALGLCYLLLY